ncbi:hypothetical protein K1719_010217 [Acacia pycnantha]|nr:hypothetical protein K1719_010217 [Acacia pycnantha]
MPTQDDLPLWGFVGELRPDKNSDNGKHFLFTHKNILIKFARQECTIVVPLLDHYPRIEAVVFFGGVQLADSQITDGRKSWIKSMILTKISFPIYARERIARKNRGFADLVPSVNKLEDELVDNGVSLHTVKARVMPSSWFLLLRFWLRVDGVLIRLRDTRLHCIFGGAENLLYFERLAGERLHLKHLSMV